MISNLIIALEAVLPMFVIMSIGVLIKRIKLITDEETKRFNSIIFHVCFGPLMFNNIYGKKIGEVFDLKLVIFTVCAVLLLYASATIFTLKVEKNQKSRGAMIQAIYRSNFIIMGIPIVANIFGSDNLTLTALMIMIVVPIYNVLAVVTLEVYRGAKPKVSRILFGLAKNPIILGALAGLLSVAFNVKLPSVLEGIISDIANVTTPMMLIILGASFSFQSVENCKRNLIFCVIGRLIIAPGIGLSLAALIGIRDVAFVTLIALFAAPTAISSFSMAQEMDSDAELAGNAVIFSSGLSCLTMFLWIFLFKTLGMF